MILGIDASQANRQIRSGTEWYAFHLLQEFKKLLAHRKDIEVRLYVRGALQADLAAGLPENFQVKILRWPLKYFWGQLRLSFEMLINPPDVLFCPAHTIPLTPALSRKGRGRIRVFTTLHDVGFEDYPELYDKLSLWYHRWAARMAVKNVVFIFTISEFSKERIIENYNCDPDRITVTHLGVVPKRSAERFGTIENKFGLRNKNYLLFVGRLEPKKNIANIIRAFEMLTPSFISPSRGGEREEVAENPFLVLAGRKLMDIPASPEIKFLNYVSEEDKWSLYRGAAIFLFPTLYEGFGLPILEAQACETPVLTSNTGSNPEIAGQGAFIVNPDSPYEIAQAVKELLANQALREEKIKLGLENIKRFSWEETAKKTLEIILSSRTCLPASGGIRDPGLDSSALGGRE